MIVERQRQIEYPLAAKVLIPCGWALTIAASCYGAVKEAAAAEPIAQYGLGALAVVVAASAIMASAYAATNYANRQYGVAVAGMIFAVLCAIWAANNHLNAFNHLFQKNKDAAENQRIEREAILAEPEILKLEIDALVQTLAVQRQTLQGAEALVADEAARGGCKAICQERISERDRAAASVEKTIADLTAARGKWREASAAAREMRGRDTAEIAGGRSDEERFVFKWVGVALIEGIILVSGWLFGIHRQVYVDPSSGQTLTTAEAQTRSSEVDAFAHLNAVRSGNAPPPTANDAAKPPKKRPIPRPKGSNKGTN